MTNNKISNLKGELNKLHYVIYKTNKENYKMKQKISNLENDNKIKNELIDKLKKLNNNFNHKR